MSGYTQTTNELLYSYYGAATVTTPTTTPGSSMTLTYPPIVVPANYMKNANSSISSSLRLEMAGLMTSTATVPTWQFFIYTAVATTSPPSFTTTNTLGSTATFTPSAETNDVWTATIHIGLRTLALGAASTVVCMGDYQCDAFSTTAFAVQTQSFVSMPGPGAYTPLATWDTTQAYILWPALSLGAGTAGNTVTTQYVKLYGEN